MRSPTGYRFVSDHERQADLDNWHDARTYAQLRKQLIKWFNENPDITPPDHIVETMNWKRRKKN